MKKQISLSIILLLLITAFSGAVFACSAVVSIEFDTQGGSIVEKQLLSRSSKATRPDDPQKEGHTFDNWYKDQQSNTPFDFDNTKIKKDTTIYAGWIINKYTITFSTLGSKVDSITLPFDSNLELFESYRTGYIFEGWYTDIECKNIFDATTMPCGDIVLYAGWRPDIDFSAFEFEKNESGYTLTKVRDLKLNLLVVPKNYNNLSVNQVGSFAFSYARQISEVHLPSTVDFVAESAFEGCTALQSVTLPNLEIFSQRMFYGCHNLQTANFSENLKQIHNSAFYGCSSLVQPQLPDSLEFIGEKGFYGCKFSSIVIPNKISVLSTEIFFNCDNLSSVVLNKNLTRISSGAFENCSSLENIDIPSGVITIGTRAFAGSGLQSIILPQSVQSIEDYLFFNCRYLKEVEILSNITNLGNHTFSSCIALDSVSLPQSLESLGTRTFENCYLLTQIILPSELTSLGSLAFVNCMTLEEIDLPVGIEKVPARTFQECGNLSRVTLPSGLKIIEDSAFVSCSSLESLILPNGIEIIGYRAFFGCTQLSELSFGDQLKQVGGQAFYGTAWLEAQTGNVYAGKVFYSGGGQEVVLNQDTVAIAGHAFFGQEITSIEFPESIEYIGDSAFEGSSLVTVSLPKSLISMGNNAFRKCTDLKTVTFPIGLKSIGRAAFLGCTSLESININAPAVTVATEAFSGCTSLKSVEISQGISSVSDEMFYNCTALKQISIPSSVTFIGSRAFFGNISLNKVELTSGLKVIGNSAFESCSSLTQIVLPDSIEAVMSYAFKESAINKVEIGSGIQTIGAHAFISSYTQGSESPVLSDPRGLTVLLHGKPIVSNNTFPASVQLKIVIFDDQLFDEIINNNYTNQNYINWNLYKNYVYSHTMLEGDWLRQGSKLITYFGDEKHVLLPDWTTEVAPYAFYGMDFINEVTLNNQLLTIGQYAFFGTSITRLDIHSSILTIGKKAFWVRTYIYQVNVNVDNKGSHAAAALGDNAFKIKGYHQKFINNQQCYKFADDNNIYDREGNIIIFDDPIKREAVEAEFEAIKENPYNKRIIFINQREIFEEYLLSWTEYIDYLWNISEL